MKAAILRVEKIVTVEVETVLYRKRLSIVHTYLHCNCTVCTAKEADYQ